MYDGRDSVRYNSSFKLIFANIPLYCTQRTYLEQQSKLGCGIHHYLQARI